MQALPEESRMEKQRLRITVSGGIIHRDRTGGVHDTIGRLSLLYAATNDTTTAAVVSFATATVVSSISTEGDMHEMPPKGLWLQM
jgi:hypothetical protein